MIKLGRITMHRFTEALEPFGIRPRHLAALIELRDHGELTPADAVRAACTSIPTNLVAILNELEQQRLRDAPPRSRGSPPAPASRSRRRGIAVIEKVSEVMDGVEDDLLAGLERGRARAAGWPAALGLGASGGYEAYSAVEAETFSRT